MLRTFDDIYETMPWDAVDAVVFDVGQVLLSYNPQEILDEHVPDRPDLHPILLEKIFRSPYWLMRDHGLMTRVPSPMKRLSLSGTQSLKKSRVMISRFAVLISRMSKLVR